MRIAILVLAWGSSFGVGLRTIETARADTGDDATAVTYYGAWVLASDAAAIALVSGGSWAKDDRLVGIGAVTYLAGGPLVHLAHGNAKGAETSAGLRFGLPVAAGVVGLGAGQAVCGDVCGFRLGVYGAGAAALVAALVDATLLAEKEAAQEVFVPLVGGTF